MAVARLVRCALQRSPYLSDIAFQCKSVVGEEWGKEDENKEGEKEEEDKEDKQGTESLSVSIKA